MISYRIIGLKKCKVCDDNYQFSRKLLECQAGLQGSQAKQIPNIKTFSFVKFCLMSGREVVFSGQMLGQTSSDANRSATYIFKAKLWSNNFQKLNNKRIRQNNKCQCETHNFTCKPFQLVQRL